jgi:uncharacterized protein YjbI with pentapeptide repeats
LSGASFNGAYLANTTLTDANLTGACFAFATVDARNAGLIEAEHSSLNSTLEFVPRADLGGRALNPRRRRR